MMRRPLLRVVLATIVAGVAAGDLMAQASSTAMQLQRISVELVTPVVIRVVLHAPPSPIDLAGAFSEQTLMLCEVSVPVASPADVLVSKSETVVRVEVDLRQVPEKVLELPLESVPLEWRGAGNGGAARLAVMGTISPLDRNQVDLPLRSLYQTYSRIADVSVKPSEGGLMVRVLASLSNPFAWDLVATKLDYRLSVGEREMCKGEQKGFRLRSGQWSDLLIEQEVALSDAAAGGLAALLRPESIRIEGLMTIRTPKGERGIKLELGAAR